MRTTVVWDEALLAYKLSSEHPLHPIRLDLTMRLARALGEAIAVTQVIGSATGNPWYQLFRPSDTIGSRIASQYQGATSNVQGAAIAYLAVILLVIALAVNVSARVIVATSVKRASR